CATSSGRNGSLEGSPRLSWARRSGSPGRRSTPSRPAGTCRRCRWRSCWPASSPRPWKRCSMSTT
ncbi:MAG: Transcriptional regulator, Xre family, partial [uncultured Blastococcus sp.]